MKYDDVARPIKKNPRGNLIKWWTIEMKTSDSDESSDCSSTEEESSVLDEANEIYERLMREAAYDEELKQKEIEEAKRNAN